jgi:transposase-like protein
LLSINYKSCLSCYQKIRLAIVRRSFADRRKIVGPVEVDESYYGGLFKNLRKETRKKLRLEGKAKRGRGAKYRKQPVFGIYRRNGSVYLELIADCTKKELQGVIKRKVKRKTSVFSDTLTSYNGLVGLGYIHKTIDHGMEIYVDGRVHINGIEGFWGLSKTNMHTYKGIRKKNWIYYLKEMEFRYNSRKLNFSQMTDKIIQILMTYRKESFGPY